MIAQEIVVKAQQVYEQAIELDYSHASSIGVLANVMAESGFNEGASEVGGAGFGLGQWTPIDNLYSQATMLGYSRSEALTFTVQADILLRGAETGQWLDNAYTGYDSLVVSPQTLNEFKKETNINSATINYMAHWERPNEDPGINHKELRKEYAKEFDEKINGSGGGGGGGKEKPHFPTKDGLPISEQYGWRTHPITGLPDFHGAIDIGGGVTNYPIYATQTGVVLSVGYNEFAGNFIVLKHTKDKYFSQYLHLKELPSLGKGVSVTKGQTIGIMGTTGSSTGIHLHFAIAINENGFGTEEGTIDPLKYLDMEFDGGGEGGGGGGNLDGLIMLLVTDALNGWKF